MDTRIFTDKNIVPVVVDLKTCHEEKTQWWQEIRDYEVEKHPVENAERNNPGKKYG